MDSTAHEAQTQDAPAPFLLESRPKTYDWLNICRYAQTMTAHSLTMNDTLYIALPCKQWRCRHCAEAKIRRLSWLTREAKPNRMLTLTVHPPLWDNPRHAFDGTRRHISTLISFLRGKYGEVEYLRVTELTKEGWPHYHLLVRSDYLPWPVIKAKWAELTGATIVDVRQVKGAFNSYKYLVKYLSKLHKIPWTERHVSYSRGFFPEVPDQERESLQLQMPKTINQHPVTVMFNIGRHSQWVKHSPHVYQCVSDPPGSVRPEDACANTATWDPYDF